MKKIEASLIKSLMRISGQDLVSLALELSHYSLSHTLGYLEFSGRNLGGRGVLGFLEQEGKGRVGKHRRVSTLVATSYCLQVPNCMYDSFTSFGMHGTCMWFLGCDLSLT